MYDDLAFVMYIDCFFDITVALKSLFPNPLDYMKIQAAGVASIAKLNLGISVGNKRAESEEDTIPVKKRTKNG
jgi:hypothetical protein